MRGARRGSGNEMLEQELKRSEDPTGAFRLWSHQFWPAVAISIGFVILYLTLDWWSLTNELFGLGITPWNPSAGLALALLVLSGPRSFGLIALAEMISAAVLRPVPASPAVALLTAFVVAGGYAGSAAMARRIGFRLTFDRASDLPKFFLAATVAAALSATGVVAIYGAIGLLPWGGVAAGAWHEGIGNAIGIVTVVPPCLTLFVPTNDAVSFAKHTRWLRVIEALAQVIMIVLVATLLILQIRAENPFEYFYVLFLPVVWIAARRGLAATSWALLTIQIALVAGLRWEGAIPTAVLAYQQMMLGLTVTGLFLGALVSQRYRLVHALAGSEAWRSAILSTARDGIVTVDAGGRIEAINPAVGQLFARPLDQLLGTSVSKLIDIPQEQLVQMTRETAASGGNPYWEFQAHRQDDKSFPVEMSVGCFEVRGAERYTLVIRDITRRRKAEEQVRQHQAELARFSRVSLAGEMAAGIAHELSQPLTAIIAYGRGCLQLLRDARPDSAMLNEGVREVVQQAERAGDILTRLREFVRFGASRRRLVAVRPMIDTVVSLAAIEATQTKVEIAVSAEPDLPAVFADNIQIEQVILNLVRNAIDAMVTDGVTRKSISIDARRKGEGAIEITVADTGPGIADDVRDKIFEPFATTKPRGMGMGLSICRSIVEAHGGQLRLLGSGRSGAVFAFDLPIRAPEENGHAG